MNGPTFNWPQDGYCRCPCLRVPYVHGIREATAGAMGGLNLHRKLHIKQVFVPSARLLVCRVLMALISSPAKRQPPWKEA